MQKGKERDQDPGVNGPLLFLQGSNLFFFFFFFVFLGPHPKHEEVPRLGVESELQLPASTSSRQHRILNPLSGDRDRTQVLGDTSWVCNPLSHNRNSPRAQSGGGMCCSPNSKHDPSFLLPQPFSPQAVSCPPLSVLRGPLRCHYPNSGLKLFHLDHCTRRPMLWSELCPHKIHAEVPGLSTSPAPQVSVFGDEFVFCFFWSF